jgi:hypothetical protein
LETLPKQGTRPAKPGAFLFRRHALDSWRYCDNTIFDCIKSDSRFPFDARSGIGFLKRRREYFYIIEER